MHTDSHMDCVQNMERVFTNHSLCVCPDERRAHQKNGPRQGQTSVAVSFTPEHVSEALQTLWGRSLKPDNVCVFGV